VIKESFGFALGAAGFLARSGKAPGGPFAVFIEPTNVCNLKCPLCACGSGSLNRPRGRMSLRGFIRIVDALPSSVATLYLWGQGEPFMANEFLGMVRYAAGKGFGTVTSTNGHFLEDHEGIAESGLGRLIVSLDGADEASYREYRSGGDFEKVVESVRRLADTVRILGRGPLIEMQVLVTAKNLGNIAAFRELSRTIGAHRVTFKTVQAASMDGGGAFLPEDLSFTRYRRATGGMLVPDRYRFLENRCLRIYNSIQVDWRGNVLPCCFDKDSEYIMGNLYNDSFADIWNGEAFRSFRKMFVNSGRILPMCRDCTEGLKRLELKL